MRKLSSQKMITIAILFIAGLWAYWNYLYSPISSRVSRLEQELSQKQSQLDTTRKAAQELSILMAELKSADIEANEIEKKLPKSEELPKLIRDITKTLEKNKITIQSFVPGESTGKIYFSEIPILLQVSGSYHNLANFLSDIGQYERVINTYDLVLAAKQSTKESPDSLTASLKLVVYMAK